MIYLIVERWHDYAIRNFVDAWGQRQRGRIAILDYDELKHARRLPRGTYVFTDHDRLSQAKLDLGAAVADALANAGCRVLSHPGKVLRRIPLLEAMHRRGINDFRAVYVARGLPGDLVYPVFLRLADDHAGPRSVLLQSRRELDAAIAASPHKNHPHLVVVEFCDTREGGAGPYRKYGVMRVADKLIPRHVYASDGWTTKLGNNVEADAVGHEDAFFETFESDHAAAVMEIFQIAGVEYGRLDFAITNGRLRVWEINSNPMIVSTPDEIDPRRLAWQQWSATRIVQAIVALDDAQPVDAPQVRIRLDAALRKRCGEGRADRVLRVLGKGVYRVRRLPLAARVGAFFTRAQWIARR